jgi:LysR family transcriptional regulator, low CO2-responsive transcriptional regulator
MIEPLGHVTLRQLQIFLAAAEHLSFVRTAEALHVTQPAVSMQMSQLAALVGIALFEKQGRKLRLTRAGEVLRPFARQMTQTLHEAGEAVNALKNLPSGKVRLALVTTSRYFAPRLLAQFRGQHPEIEFEVSIANREGVIAQLENGEVDLAIMGRTPAHLATTAKAFAQHPHVIIAPPGHRLTSKKRIDPDKINDDTFLVREPGSGTRLSMEQYFTEYGIHPSVMQEMTSSESIKQAVMAGMGLAFISVHTIGLECQTGNLAILDIKGLPIMRTWYVLHLKETVPSQAMTLFMKFMQDEAPDLLEGMFPGSRLPE